MRQYNMSFVVRLSDDIYIALERMARIQGKHPGVSSFARELLEKGVPCRDLPNGPDTHSLTIRVNSGHLNLIDREAVRNKMKRGAYVRRVLTRQLNEFFEKAVADGEVERHRFPLLLRWHKAGGLLISLGLLLFLLGLPLMQRGEVVSPAPPPDFVFRGSQPDWEENTQFMGACESVYAAHLSMGIFLFKRAEYRLALIEFKYALSVHETNEVRVWISNTYLRLGQPKQAELWLSPTHEKK